LGVSKAGRTPAGAPFHEGDPLLKEKGSGLLKTISDAVLTRMKKVQELWKVTLQEIKSKGLLKKISPILLNKRMEIKD